MVRPRLRHLRADATGAVLLEFAVALPVLLLLFFGVYEISRYLLFRERLESTATQMLDLITQAEEIDDNSLAAVYATLPEMMRPYSATNARIITTQIIKPGANCRPYALWQYRPGGSRVAPAVGGAVDLDRIELESGDNVMAIEITADYRPIEENSFVSRLIGQYTQYVQVYGHTRYGTFSKDPVTGVALPPNCVQ